MLSWQTLALIGGGAGLVIGIPLARSSHQANPLYSGVGQAFHYLACSAMAGVPVSILIGIVSASGRSGVLVALVLLAAAALLLIIHAIPERLAMQRQPR